MLWKNMRLYTSKTAYSRNKTKFLEKWKMKTQKEFNTDTSKNIIAILWVRTNNLQLRRQVLNRNTTVTSYCQNSKKKHDTIQAKTAYSRNKTKFFGKMIFAKTKINPQSTTRDRTMIFSLQSPPSYRSTTQHEQLWIQSKNMNI